MLKFISYQLCKVTYSTVHVCRYTSDLGMFRFYHLTMNNIFNTHEGIPEAFMVFHKSQYTFLPFIEPLVRFSNLICNYPVFS